MNKVTAVAVAVSLLPGGLLLTGAGGQPAAAARPAAAVLGDLQVQGRGPMTGYSRTRFGPAWADIDRNGCDTRNDLLTRDLTREAYKTGTRNCVVTTGMLADPYTARTITFSRTRPSAVQIDHVVALGDAWAKGARAWTPAKRLTFANDPLNLLAVDGPTNQSKADADAASWLPPSKGYRCRFIARQVSVKYKYKLTVTAAERDASARVLATCPAQPALYGGAPLPTDPTPSPTTASAPSPTPAPAPTSAPVSSSPSPAATTGTTAPPAATTATTAAAVYYASCDDARAAGAAPLRAGQPGYRPVLDRDGDGVACE